MARFWIVIPILIILLCTGCYIFNNPVDPKAADYQGYESARPTTPPAAPLALNVGVIGITDREHQVKLTWTDTADNEEGFLVQRKVGAGSYTTVATLGIDSVQYTDTTLSGDTTYTFRVLAYNIAGSSSSVEPSWSTAPAAPTGLLVAASGASNITVQWDDNSTTRDGYKIEHCTDGVSWAEIATVSVGPFNQYEATGLPAGPHYYRVRAYSLTTGDSNYSNEISHTL